MARNRFKRWKKKSKRLFVCLGVAALVLGSAIVELQSKKWTATIEKFYVLGTSEISSLDVRTLLGIQKGDRLFGEWKKQAKQKLEENPRIASATIVRNLAGDVVVKVAERKAVAYLNIDRLYSVDQDGNILGLVKNDEKGVKDLIVITGPWNKKSSPEEIQKKVLEAMSVRSAWISEGSDDSEISELHYDNKKGWMMYRVASSARCILGRGPFEQKILRLQRVLKDFAGKENQLKEIDVDFDDRAVVKLSG